MSDDAETAPVFTLRQRQELAARLVTRISQAQASYHDAGEYLAGTSALTGEPAIRALITDVLSDMNRVETRIIEVSRIARRRLEALQTGMPKITTK